MVFRGRTLKTVNIQWSLTVHDIIFVAKNDKREYEFTDKGVLQLLLHGCIIDQNVDLPKVVQRGLHKLPTVEQTIHIIRKNVNKSEMISLF